MAGLCCMGGVPPCSQGAGGTKVGTGMGTEEAVKAPMDWTTRRLVNAWSVLMRSFGC